MGYSCKSFSDPVCTIEIVCVNEHIETREIHCWCMAEQIYDIIKEEKSTRDMLRCPILDCSEIRTDFKVVQADWKVLEHG